MTFVAGQRWSYRCREVDVGSTFVVLRVDHVPHYGAVAQVVIQGLVIKEGEMRLPIGPTIFTVFTCAALDRSVVALVSEGETVADAPRYESWRECCDRGDSAPEDRSILELIVSLQKGYRAPYSTNNPEAHSISEHALDDEGHVAITLHVGETPTRGFIDSTWAMGAEANVPLPLANAAAREVGYIQEGRRLFVNRLLVKGRVRAGGAESIGAVVGIPAIDPHGSLVFQISLRGRTCSFAINPDLRAVGSHGFWLDDGPREISEDTWGAAYSACLSFADDHTIDLARLGFDVSEIEKQRTEMTP